MIESVRFSVECSSGYGGIDQSKRKGTCALDWVRVFTTISDICLSLHLARI
jgi:hypothetical protein